MNKTPLLNICHLSVSTAKKKKEHTILNDISLYINKGERLALVGESGSGKTMLAKTITSLLPKGCLVTQGQILFSQKDLLKISNREMHKLRGKHISFVLQNALSSLTPSMRIGHQITEPLRHHLKMTMKESVQKALSLLESVKITDPERIFRAYPFELSGGMKQRIVIAIALCCNPDLVIADEPTTALDSISQWRILSLLNELQQQHGSSLLLITHNLAIVPEFCDRVAIMKDGEIVESGPVKKIFSSPQHPYTQQLIQSISKIPLPIHPHTQSQNTDSSCIFCSQDQNEPSRPFNP